MTMRSKALMMGVAAVAVAMAACTSMDSNELAESILPRPVEVVVTGSGSLSVDSATVVETILVDSLPGVTSPEGYLLTVGPDGVRAEATTEAGLFYARQTLHQLAAIGNGRVAECRILDYPRFAYRGLMIDVSRNFRDKAFILKQIDAMAMMKLNRLHFHLVDAAGWRFEVDSYPKLTEMTAWRHPSPWRQWDGRFCPATDPQAYGGFYTKADLREIVAYAAERHITVIPEIEMPGHAAEVLVAYPELSCSGEAYRNHELCVGNEATFVMLQAVLDEVMEIFPSEYIHIGGDEAGTGDWARCPKCRRRMAEEGIADPRGLQGYMIHRIADYLASKGRRIVGWDEIADDELPEGAAVLVWRGSQQGYRAAALGHEAIMAPGKYCYLDGYQDAPATQPQAIGGYLPLSLAYDYDPAPDSLSASVSENVVGLEATLFTEFIPTDSHAEYMLYPRLLAVAEVGWTQQQLRDYDSFRRRALAVGDRMVAKGYNVFDLRSEVGNRPEALRRVDHLARGKRVSYNGGCAWSPRYPAAAEATLTDGLCGGWNYNDLRWQGFFTTDSDLALDVTIDLEATTEIGYVGADFMQICGPDVWFPTRVVISVSEEEDEGREFAELTAIDCEPQADDQVSFRTFSWSGRAAARYVRYQAYNRGHFLFVDEIKVEGPRSSGQE